MPRNYDEICVYARFVLKRMEARHPKSVVDRQTDRQSGPTTRPAFHQGDAGNNKPTYFNSAKILKNHNNP